MRNKLGVHALVWVGGWSHDDAALAIRSSKAAGYDLIEIPALDPSRIDVEHTRAELVAAGLSAGVSLGLNVGSDVNSEDTTEVDRGRALLADALGVAKGIGSPYLGGVLFSALAKYPRPTTPKARANSISAIRDLAREAQRDGITVGLEFVNRYESNLLNTTRQTLDFIDEVGEDNVVVHMDVYHMNIEEDGFRTPVLDAGERLGYVHVGESHRGYLGTGNVNFPEFFDALREIDYSGPITFESFSSAVVDPNLSNTLAVWRNLWSDGMDLATHARAFIESGLGNR